MGLSAFQTISKARLKYIYTQMRTIVQYLIKLYVFIIHFYKSQPQVTAKNSADEVLGDIAADGAIAALNISNFVLAGCRLTHVAADLQGFGNFEGEAGPLYASKSCPVVNGGTANAGVALKQSRRLPKNNEDQVQDSDCQTDPRMNTRVTVVN